MKNVAKRLIDKVCLVSRQSINTVLYFKADRKNCIVINAWINLYGPHLEHRNLGDELNVYLIEELTGKKVFNYCNLLPFAIQNYCCIGSIVDTLANHSSVVWGAGAIYGKDKQCRKPLKVCAVRGPLTREYLLGKGIDCPEVYGDPALLLPLIYKPEIKKKYKIGLIPHISDINNPNVRALVRQVNEEDITIIKLEGYADWHDVIDEINECEFIISSSLHGLILSDAYQIPNVWVEFSDRVAGHGFKFRDYFASVGREANSANAIRITGQTKLKDLLAYKEKWCPTKIDLNKLLKACPFELKDKYRKI